MQSNTSSSSPLYVNYASLPDETYYLNATVNDTTGNSNNTETRTIILDMSVPIVYLNSPENGTYENSLTVWFAANFTNDNLKNTTLYIWNSSGATY